MTLGSKMRWPLGGVTSMKIGPPRPRSGPTSTIPPEFLVYQIFRTFAAAGPF